MMLDAPQAVIKAAQIIVDAVDHRRPDIASQFLVAIDGPSGSGKSSIASAVCELLDGALVESDDFFAADLTDEDWDSRSPAARARDCIDWRRLREEALVPLRAGRTAVWFPFDWDAGPLPDGTYGLCETATRVLSHPLIVLDGAYSARVELSDLVDMTVLVKVPPDLRRSRLAERDGTEFFEDWVRRWGPAESYYFGELRPPAAFDIVVENT